MSDHPDRDPKPRRPAGRQDESDLATDRCPDCGALSLEARAPAAGAALLADAKPRVGVPAGHSLTCENCGRMWTRRK